MKKVLIAVFALALFACGEQNKKEQKPEVAEEVAPEEEISVDNSNDLDGYLAFGEKITTADAVSSAAMHEMYQDMKLGDTLDVKFVAEVSSVCKKKGCWMKVELDEDELARVDFKDYAFFVPMDIENKEVIMQGKAYLKEISVDALKHYAEDAGKSEEEIAAITEPELTLSFTADGVLVEK